MVVKAETSLGWRIEQWEGTWYCVDIIQLGSVTSDVVTGMSVTQSVSGWAHSEGRYGTLVDWSNLTRVAMLIFKGGLILLVFDGRLDFWYKSISL